MFRCFSVSANLLLHGLTSTHLVQQSGLKLSMSPCVLQVQFSPDGRWIVSASFDKAVKLWDGVKGTFITTFRGHVRPVYQVSWSSDSRLVVSGSSDSTLKVTCCLDCNYLVHLVQLVSWLFSIKTSGVVVMVGGQCSDSCLLQPPFVWFLATCTNNSATSVSAKFAVAAGVEHTFKEERARSAWAC